jgi:hypothetical protein
MSKLRHIAALLAVGCGDGAHPPVPNLGDPTCSWVEAEVYTASECTVLTASEGYEARFLAEGDTSCSGVPCLVLGTGETATVIGPITEYVRFTHAQCHTFCP